jgi:O-antigen ligase
VGVVTACLVLIWFLYNRRTLYLGNTLLPLFLFGVLILISFWFTRDVERTTFYIRRWAFNMVFALMLINLVTKFDVLKKVIWTVIIMASLNAIVGIFHYASAPTSYYRSIGLLENANSFGHFAALAFPLAFYQYLYRSGAFKWVGLGLSGVCAGGVVVSVSRGATLSLLLVFGAILVIERRRVGALALVMILGICMTPFLPGYFFERVSNLATDVKRSVLVDEEHDLTSRGYFNRAGFKMWMAHPVLGVGIGNFGHYYVQKEFHPGYKRVETVVAHNIYMQAFAEMGTLGGLLLFWLIGLAVRNVISARRASRADPDSWLYFGAIEMMALAVFISVSTYGNLMRSDFWMFVLLTAISGRVAVSEQTKAGASNDTLQEAPA